ncbi:SMC domain-containing protein [[Clostridium] sordellii]|uniref:AAA family ATPase n=1 Tax=Paraclostridium sordellii TaxID=1505 RepID=UPI0005E9F93E|nr:AAA family ATPase [Paeniclostridium sordellii]CEP92066.1 SMC domain-containing protein [[Clostridium] sordellii] [Paeniclostridium sordellii]
MKLKRLILKNFRGYSLAKVDFDSDMNIIVGKNDVGKSTIMEALDIFFNGNTRDSQTKIDVYDLYIHSENPTIEITCLFECADTSIVLDSTSSTTLKNEYLLNANNLLEIKKVWNCSRGKISANDLKIYIISNYPDISENHLINLKITELRKMLTTIKDDIPNFDEVKKNTSSKIRAELYNYYLKNGCDFKETPIDAAKEDAKEIWSKISKSLPIFFLFKSDRSNVDSDSEVQNPLKIATKNVLKELSDELDIIKSQVEEAVKVISSKTIKKLQEMDSDIAANLNTELSTKAWDSIFTFEIIDERGIPLNKRGSGVRRLMLLSYFRAEAERIVSETDKNNIIYAIEEPETSQHPNYQTMIMDSLLTLSNTPNHQIIITTHTPEIAKMVDISQIIFINKDSNGHSQIVDNDQDKLNGVIKSLGLLPDIYTKLVIFVEGPTDVKFLEHISKLDSFKKIIDLNNENISIIPLIGGNLKTWINQNYLNNSSIKEVHIYDSDVEDYRKLVEDMNKSLDPRRTGLILKRREIENYIPAAIIEKQLDIFIDDSTKENWSEIDVPKLIMEKYGQKKKMRDSNVKMLLNGRVAKKITEDDLKSIGAFDEILTWFKSIKTMYSSNISFDEVTASE